MRSLPPQVPRFDSFALRMTSSDAPSDDLSHFKRDMTEASTVLRDSSADSLVMLDELGQGTEGRHAAAIGAAILSKLDEIVRAPFKRLWLPSRCAWLPLRRVPRSSRVLCGSKECVVQ